MVDRSKARILLVEDEKNVGSTLTSRLRQEGYEVSWLTTAESAREEITRSRFDLALLDIGLPGESGFEVAAAIRKIQPAMAMIFLTAFGDPESRVHGLELGAEDYVVKPFYFKELVLRIENGLKRVQYLRGTGERVQLGKATVDFAKYEVVVEGKAQSLTQKEAALLKLLLDRQGAVVSRDEILDQVWSGDEYPTNRTVDNFIMRLRRLIEKDPENPELIRSVRGVGYQLIR